MRTDPRRQGTATGEAGSGTAIGVAIIFPMLMLVIVALAGLTRSSRTEQVLQAAADRAALAASVCCLHVGGPGGAMQVVEANLATASRGWRHSDVACSNDIVAHSETAFFDVTGHELGPIDPGTWSDPGDLYMLDRHNNVVTRDADGDPAAFDPDYVVFQPDGTAAGERLAVTWNQNLRRFSYTTGSLVDVLDPLTGNVLYSHRNGSIEHFVADQYVGVGEPVTVPPGGLVQVLVECQMPPEVLGSVGLPGINITHRAVGVATVDPYRHRSEPIGSP